MRNWLPISMVDAICAHPLGLWKITAHPSEKASARYTPGMGQLHDWFFVRSHLVFSAILHHQRFQLIKSDRRGHGQRYILPDCFRQLTVYLRLR